jgi:predicted nuclease of restriction endonuclease-like (RecB) superfamily
MTESLDVGGEYELFLRSLKEQIQNAQVRAALAVNRELILLYWQIGQGILERQAQFGWGAKVVDKLARDLRQEFPEIRGFSPRNLKYMRLFSESYPDEELVQQVVALIPWGHNIKLLELLKARDERLWHAMKTIANGWSRSVLVHQIESQLLQRQGGATTNFEQVLPAAQSELAQQIIKDPYNFDFLTIESDRLERTLEKGLIAHIRDFLLELGMGFAFVGSQYPIEVSGREYRLDLLFYHVTLHCYVVLELKTTEFEPEYSGKMNFYVAAVDNLLRGDRDEPTIGIILCKSKDRTIVEYALQGVQKPIGVSTYRLGGGLPEVLRRSLPSLEQLELELGRAIDRVEQGLDEGGKFSG